MTRSVRQIFALAAVAAALPALAALELGAPFTDGAVLQRDTPLRIWGSADAGSTVAVTFGEKSWTTTAGTDGAWRLTLPPMAASAEPKVGPLSRREIEVLTYIAQGKTHEEIGMIGDISAETVRTHMKSIFRKLDCTNAPAAVSRAYELGILRA